MTLSLQQIKDRAGAYGLVIRGGFSIDIDDSVPPLKNGKHANTLILFGNTGSSIWPIFSQSEEYLDGDADPLNRWSERIGDMLAAQWGGIALFPFGGPPYQPFLNWAKKSEQLQSSKLGMLIHPEYGLWHAYRFAIALPEVINMAAYNIESNQHACDRCASKPCLSGCPVDAFNGEYYDVEKCFTYLDQHPQAKCHQVGCLARVACPEGQGYRYQADHAAFHMEKFVDSLREQFLGS